MPKKQLNPDNLTIHVYQVGFGDCFLLTFHYPKQGTTEESVRNILIDFGTSALPKGANTKLMLNVAKDIQSVCKNQLDAIIVSHRHLDHISGFTRSKGGNGTGDIIRGLKPGVVVQPWTEDPDAQKNATAPTAKNDPGSASLRALANMQNVAASFLKQMNDLEGKLGKRRLTQLKFYGETNLKNSDAVKNLMSMKKNVYVYHGSRSGLESILPGVTVHVLGPPTLKQSDAIRQERKKDQDEFWHLQAIAGQRFTVGSPRLFPRATIYQKGSKPPPYARWLIPRMLAMRADQLLELVRILDDQMNNTSVILLFETANKKILFPGDAQIENWSYALKESPKAAALKTLLADTDFYKVGHHGSLNATPKTLWGLFKHKGPNGKPDRLMTVVSTREGKHGSVDKGTEVPRGKLVDELKKNSDYFTTQAITPKDLKKVITIPL
jgi:hypothetical protein